MRHLVLGTVAGFLAASTLAWAFTVRFPNVLRVQGNAIVDEAGNIRGGSTPLKVSLSDAPPLQVSLVDAPAPVTQVLVDDNGMVVGPLSRPYDATSEVFVTRVLGGVTAEFKADHLTFEGSGSGILYYENPGCAGPPFANLNGGFYPITFVSGGTLYYALGPPEAVSIVSSQSLGPSGPDQCGTQVVNGILHPVGTFDLTQFVPPFVVASQ